MNSKLELRLEAARIAAKLDDVTIENFPEAASRIEHYLLGEATLPEQDSAMPELMDMLKSARQRMEHAFDRSETGMGIGPCTVKLKTLVKRVKIGLKDITNSWLLTLQQLKQH